MKKLSIYSDLNFNNFDFSYSFMRCISKSYTLHYSDIMICYFPHWCPECGCLNKGYSIVLDFLKYFDR